MGSLAQPLLQHKENIFLKKPLLLKCNYDKKGKKVLKRKLKTK